MPRSHKIDEVRHIKRISSWYLIMVDQLYKMGRSSQCWDVSSKKKYVPHEGSAWRSTRKPHWMKRFVLKNTQGRVLLAEYAARLSMICKLLREIPGLCPLYTFTSRIFTLNNISLTFLSVGAAILNHFPLAVGQLKFPIMADDYFTKWVEDEAVSQIST